MALSDIALITITTSSVGAQAAGFGIPLLLGAVQNATFGTDRIRFYTGTAGMLSDGFLTTDPEYIAALQIFAQPNPPTKIAVGRRVNKPTMQFKITVLQAVVGKRYSVFVNGVEKFYVAIGGDTTTNIATGLAAAIGTPAGFGAATAAVAVVTLTASAAGNWLRVAVAAPNVDLDCWQSHADNAVQTELAAIATIDSSWYAVMSMFAGTIGATNTSEVGQIAAWVEANQKLYLASVQDSTIIGVSTTDICSNLKALAYARTAPLFHPDNGAFAAEAWGGLVLPMDPGSEDWKFKTLVGVTPVSLTATQHTNADGKNCNTYELVAGKGITSEGVVADREFVDVIRFRDWLQTNLQIDIFNDLTSTRKIPYTDAGAAVIEKAIRARIEVGVAQGGISKDTAYTVTVPKVATQAGADRTARKMRNITFTAPLAGSIHSLVISGTVTV